MKLEEKIMIKLYDGGAWLIDGKEVLPDSPQAGEIIQNKYGKKAPEKKEAARNTIAYSILKDHNTSGNMEELKIKFDKLTSHDITFVGIIQTARASGLEKFPIPYVLTNCHNSLCAVGGTINEDDHMFGLTCAKRYGGVYVPPHQAVIHQFAREMLAEGGKMILGSDSHTRYGALGTMAMGEGGPELVKQLLGRTYDIKCPEVVGIYMTGKPVPGVGPQDVALAIIGAVFANGYVKNKVMEFVGPGVDNLSADFRIGVDVMTTETHVPDQRFPVALCQFSDGMDAKFFQLLLRRTADSKQFSHRKRPHLLRHFLRKQRMYFVRFLKIRRHFRQQTIGGNADIYRKAKLLPDAHADLFRAFQRFPEQFFRSRHIHKRFIDTVLLHTGRILRKELHHLSAAPDVLIVIRRKYQKSRTLFPRSCQRLPGTYTVSLRLHTLRQNDSMPVLFIASNRRRNFLNVLRISLLATVQKTGPAEKCAVDINMKINMRSLHPYHSVTVPILSCEMPGIYKTGL